MSHVRSGEHRLNVEARIAESDRRALRKLDEADAQLDAMLAEYLERHAESGRDEEITAVRDLRQLLRRPHDESGPRPREKDT